jgi:hypothetical protein
MAFKDDLISQGQDKWMQLKNAEHERDKLEAFILDLRSYLADLNPLLIREGADPFPLDGEKRGRPTGFAAPGNRSADMPQRRPQFAGMTLGESVDSILESGNAYHVDELARQIYELRRPEDLKLAKRSLVSTLADGARKGRWLRPLPNTFAALPTPAPNDGRPREMAFTR